jgi:hypothetical protein
VSSDERERRLLDELAQAYRRLPRDEPSPELDAAVLAQARAALGPRRALPRWGAGLGMAAVLALAVGLSWQVRQRDEAQMRPLPVTVPAAEPVPEPRRVPATPPAASGGRAEDGAIAAPKPEAAAAPVPDDAVPPEPTKEIEAPAGPEGDAASSAGESSGLETITVVGSRIKRTDVETAHPVFRLEREPLPRVRATGDEPAAEAVAPPPPPPREPASVAEEPVEALILESAPAPAAPPAPAAAPIVRDAPEPFPGADESRPGRDRMSAPELDAAKEAAGTRAGEAAAAPGAEREDLGALAGQRERAAARELPPEDRQRRAATLDGARADQEKDADDRDGLRRQSRPAQPAPAPAAASAPAHSTGVVGASERKREGYAALAPDEWLAEIRRWRAAGDIARAREELRAFQRTYPDATIPRDLRDLLPP